MISHQNSWPFIEARKILERLHHTPPKKGYVLLQTGYGPSGLPHIGTFGEVARTTMVKRALETQCPYPVKLFSFSDDMDGMRKVPDNVPNQDMLTQHLGKPLTQVPDPFGQYESFAHHNNAMLRRFLDSFGFDYEFKSATECYKSGLFDPALKKVLEHYDDIMAVMLPSLREQRQATYSPFLPVCPRTGRVLQVPIIERKMDSYTIVYRDPDTNEFMETPITGGHCKLQWKVDWAARWYMFDVDYEMCGKDHIENTHLSGKICRIMGGTPPEHLIFELFLDEKGEKISKSKGNGLSIDEWLTYAPVESLAYYMYQSPKKAKRLYFDVIPKNVDEFLQQWSAIESQEGVQRKDNPIWHVMGDPMPACENGPSFSVLLNLVSVCHSDDPKVIWGFVSRYSPNANPTTMPYLNKLIHYAIAYYRDFVKPFEQFKVPNEQEKQALIDLKTSLESLNGDEAFDVLQNKVFEVGKKYYSHNLKEWFELLYEVLLGQKQGPRMGSFIELYGISNTIALIHEKLSGASNG